MQYILTEKKQPSSKGAACTNFGEHVKTQLPIGTINTENKPRLTG